ncbi:Peptidoglycan-N-acetylmuramic acid deacetylase PdaC [Aquicella siphonis]|uniref:Peptidoglycan-N-acetylmuramic acid deacetylase PdaC n=1 Tax=Aquicella siphonis TaxID=254247 RepID=A0A5E4PD73_9COXI|nr:RsiV family protein [Aquicella siphonis]VVC74830.1 Peptidoglycan-N-acetylmuramic acid deacetylase PdaC [Aquicella siphonis]
MIKSIHWSVLISFFISLAAFSPSQANPADEDSGLEDSMTFHVYDDVDLVSTLKFEYGRPRIIIKSVYPQLVSETDHAGVDTFNEMALQYVKDEIALFRERVKDHAEAQKKIPKDKITNNLYIDYNTSYIKSKRDHIISIRFSIQGYVGGTAEPYHTHRVLNYNLDKNQAIELSDLFIPGSNYLEILSRYTRFDLARRLKNSSRIADGTLPVPESFANWNIKPTGIVITFDENRVAPDVYGAQTVLVPYSALSEVIAPDSPVADCIAHRSRCLSNNLLTGGFIDEAANTNHGRFNPILGKL